MTVLPFDEAIRGLKDDYKDTLTKIQTLKAYFNARAKGCDDRQKHKAISYIADEWHSCNNKSYPFPRSPVCCLEHCPLGRIK